MVAGNIAFWRDDDQDDGDEPERLSERELQKRIIRKQQNLSNIQDEVSKHQDEYMKLLDKGSEAGGWQRKIFAMRAKFEKLKYNLLKLDALTELKEMLDLHSRLGISQVEELKDRVEGKAGVSGDLPDIDPAEIQEEVGDVRAEVESEMRQMQSVMEGFETAADFDDISLNAGQEEQIMDELRERDISTEEISPEDLPDVSEDVDTDLDLGIDTSDDDLLTSF